MNPLDIVKKITKPAIDTIETLIDKIGPSLRKTIKQAYFFLIFILIMIGLIIGYRKGRDAAGIHLPPLVENINDAFDIKMRKERGGNFDSLLESEIIAGQKNTPTNKIPFPSQAPLEMEYEGGIIDYKPEKREASGMELNVEPLDGAYTAPINKRETQVRQLNKNHNTTENTVNSPIPFNPQPLKTEESPIKDNIKLDTDIPNTEKKSLQNSEQKASIDNLDISPIKDNTDIIDGK